MSGKEWYQEQLQKDEWKKRAHERRVKENFTCLLCGAKDVELHVHHIRYFKGWMPWEYQDVLLPVLCKKCHEDIHDS